MAALASADVDTPLGTRFGSTAPPAITPNFLSRVEKDAER